MKHIKLFEEYNLKGNLLYHGTHEKHNFKDGGDTIPGSTFLAEDINVARSYGKYVYEVKIRNIKIFDTLNKEDLEKLFDEFGVLYDNYYDIDEEGHEIKSVDQLMNSSDNWQPIEQTPGVLGWISSQGYRGVRIIEGGSESNILLLYPKEDILSFNLIEK